jgi:tetratricopeptide (TPR) repeat protein
LTFEAVILQSALFCRRFALSLVLVTALMSLSGSAPAQSPTKKPRVQSDEVSPYQELQKRLQAQHDAIQSGNPATVETTSQALAAFALRGMAQIRSAEAAWPQAIELFRQSLVLEDDQSTRLDLVNACIAAGRYEDGLILINQTLAGDPKNSQAWYLKGKLLMSQGDERASADAVARSLELHRDANAQLLLAQDLLNLKEKEKAHAVFRQMLQDYGDRAIWHFVFGGAYRDAGYQEDAVREFKKALELDPNLPHVHYFLGLTYLEINNMGPSPEIIKEYEEEVRQFPNDFFGNYTLGGIESGASQYEQSDKHLMIAAKAGPNNPDPWLYLGINAYKQRDNATAEKYLRKAIALTGDDTSRNGYNIRRGYIALARILAGEGKKEEAQPYFDKAKVLSDLALQNSSEAIRSEMAANQDSAPGVIPSTAAPKPQLPATASDKVDFTADIGASQLEKTRLTPAQLEEAEKRVKSLRAMLGTSYNDWGTSEAKRGQYGMALSHFHDAEKWDDATPGLMRNVGLAALKLGNNEEAARAFQLAVDKDPKDTSARAMLAISLYSSHQYAEAAKAFGMVGDGVYRDPRMAYAWAFSLARINDPQKTIEVLNRLTTQPLPKEMWMATGDLYAQVDDQQDALRCFLKAIELDPTMERAHHFAGVALIRLGRPSEAIPQFEAELKLSRDDPDTQYNLAYALLETSQKDQALALLRTLLAAHPDHAQAQYQLGKELLAAGSTEEAVPHLEAATRLDPQDDYVHYQLQAAYRKAGRTADADKELQVYREIKDQKRQQSVPQHNQ